MNLLFKGVFAAAIFIGGHAVAQPTGSIKTPLDGVWTGEGQVTLSNGQTETATCEIRYKKYSVKSYKLLGRCSTASIGVVEQTAVVKEAGGNAYRGRFSNPEYNVEGDIYIALKNSTSQTATLTTNTGKGQIVLTRAE